MSSEEEAKKAIREAILKDTNDQILKDLTSASPNRTQGSNKNKYPDPWSQYSNQNPWTNAVTYADPETQKVLENILNGVAFTVTEQGFFPEEEEVLF